MKITKYAHSCLLVEVGNTRILTDPGRWNRTPDAKGVDAVLITHEHADHCDVGKLREVIAANPGVRVITHEAVGKKLREEEIDHEIVDDAERVEIKGISIESCGMEHAIIYGTTSPCRNTGFVIHDDLFIPGDALHDIPSKPIRVLALPTGGPWMRLSEAIDYAKRLQPKIVFPIHDAMYTEDYRSDLIPRMVGGTLESAGIQFIDMPPETTREF